MFVGYDEGLEVCLLVVNNDRLALRWIVVLPDLAILSEYADLVSQVAFEWSHRCNSHFCYAICLYSYYRVMFIIFTCVTARLSVFYLFYPVVVLVTR